MLFWVSYRRTYLVFELLVVLMVMLVPDAVCFL